MNMNEYRIIQVLTGDNKGKFFVEVKVPRDNGPDYWCYQHSCGTMRKAQIYLFNRLTHDAEMER